MKSFRHTASRLKVIVEGQKSTSFKVTFIGVGLRIAEHACLKNDCVHVQ